ncbi:MAG: repressor protein [Candidatus Magasanikbacteria bacterium RIFCSPLOWO2_01_FULL_43_20b]|uniref:Repressor protein n=1 Tax=Candidatus Magasanikbacteria bacterium RIFCSPLOWO2_12_FULL_43_12 TaxID=1798692 RepID=A0A1F6MU08_9BACT|nr:MAG: repressor protein [Candidatus Magasanikbacteria bacterium RIFCSPHIGHO2_02_FULL_44_13]OGH72607.1 MAG: repressor protein [Candidatus Magasanikbacteria bacterium RIFCSPLOWO2_02_FULL_43_22]OGH72964.1 MAG: repressor protein [Candidatus Magasanikbacteria bacterium RIFCSPLOWO2_01_FULL_43_20b]OGH75018.1 MAG: repressor protein [Candidatus Magasanikbacteria bacterium RIFCSPLOWO2_12_FULL_43_12]
MFNKIAQYIFRLRKDNNFSQDYLAGEIGMSRPTYIQIEKGARELTISEAQKLADIFGLALADFLAMDDPKKFKINLSDKSLSKAKEPQTRISIPQEQLAKFKEVLLYILEKVGAKPNIGETVLYKLLYFVDFDYYEKFEEQLIGARYIKNHYGPTPVAFKKIIESMKKSGDIEVVHSKYFQYEQKKYLPRRRPNLTALSAQEIAHIDGVLNRLSDKTAAELSDYSHKDIPYLAAENGQVLSYESVFYRDDEHSQKEYVDEL